MILPLLGVTALIIAVSTFLLCCCSCAQPNKKLKNIITDKINKIAELELTIKKLSKQVVQSEQTIESFQQRTEELEFENKELKSKRYIGQVNVLQSEQELLDHKKAVKEELEKTDQRVEELRQQSEESHTCVVCMDEPRSVVFVSCRHMVACSSCASRLHACPVCRKKIEESILVIK